MRVVSGPTSETVGAGPPAAQRRYRVGSRSVTGMARTTFVRVSEV